MKQSCSLSSFVALLIAPFLLPINALADELPAKTALDDNGAPLAPGDTITYSLVVRNLTTEDALNSVLRDAIPANSTYVLNSTTMDGIAIADQPSTYGFALFLGYLGVSTFAAVPVRFAPKPRT